MVRTEEQSQYEQSTSNAAREANLADAFGRARRQRSGFRRAIYMLRRNYLGVVGITILTIVILMAIFAPVLAPHDPNLGSIVDRLRCPIGTTCPVYGSEGETFRGSSEYILGTDQLGRDILSRIIYGARISLIVGLTAVLAGAGVGVTLGLISAYYGGWMDSLVMRVGEVFLAFPFLLLAIALMAVLGVGLLNVIVVLAVANWILYARIMRGSVLSTKAEEYITAARAIGARDYSVLFKHLLPNCITPIIIFATFNVAAMIIAEAGLSFLGLGAGAGWGLMLADGRDYVNTAWWLATIPGLAIMLTVLSINLIGDWMRDALDPRLRNIS
jgi:peptide/nickel transport system permease protein